MSSAPAHASGPDTSVILRLQPQVLEAITPYVGRQEALVVEALGGARFVPAGYKRPFALQGLTDPWSGLTALEREGRHLADLAGLTGNRLPALVDRLEAGMTRVSGSPPLLPIPSNGGVKDHIAYMSALLQQAEALRETALHTLSRDDRQFLFEHTAAIVENFSPQRSGESHQEMTQARLDRKFAQLLAEQVDYGAFITEAKLIARLDDEPWLQQVATLFHGVQPLATTLNGITGDLLFAHETPSGLIVIGGAGPNTYDLDARFAFVIDVGGDDTYRGTIAAAEDVQHGANIVIDLSGNDQYDPSPLGLATGRLGVGLLVDRAGDDVYRLSPGSGGSGFAGIGILHDRAGRDRYIGNRFTQGAAVGGLGLLVDDEGDDAYTSFGYAIGFGGPSGVGAVIDIEGDDSYQSGETYPSRYNDADAPDAKPRDPRFQYDAFGIGMGTGIRIISKNPDFITQSLAGGWGLIIDLKGNDRYRSSNFSQGVGYFFGIGMKLDLAGNDEHAGARYGHGAGAHYGVGLFIDADGQDRYSSTGPFYNGGTAWDLSVSLCIDAGQGDDAYDLARSDGLGRADHRSWSLFVDEGGSDRYVVRRGLGAATDRSVSGFVDLSGEDEYVMAPVPAQVRGEEETRGNGQVVVDGAGGVFIDR